MRTLLRLLLERGRAMVGISSLLLLTNIATTQTTCFSAYD
jgi:hypothetical protein